jgi:NitT/TauT family transport system permease protein
VGYGLAPKIIVVALIAFFPIVVNMVDGLKSVDPDVVHLLRILGANRWQVFVKVQLPSRHSSVPNFCSSLLISISSAIHRQTSCRSRVRAVCSTAA